MEQLGQRPLGAGALPPQPWGQGAPGSAVASETGNYQSCPPNGKAVPNACPLGRKGSCWVETLGEHPGVPVGWEFPSQRLTSVLPPPQAGSRGRADLGLCSFSSPRHQLLSEAAEGLLRTQPSQDASFQEAPMAAAPGSQAHEAGCPLAPEALWCRAAYPRSQGEPVGPPGIGPGLSSQ